MGWLDFVRNFWHVALMLGIDLFAGAGGMSLGARQSGIDVMSAVERDPWAAATHAHNLSDTTVFSEDIGGVKAKKLLTQERNAPLVIFGGPPCKGFSTSNQKTRHSSNPHNWLFREYIRIVQDLRPEWLVFENVKGMIETEKGIFLQAVLESFASLNYEVSWRVLNSVDYGIPQRRNRLFIVGCLNGRRRFEFPSGNSGKFTTVRDALADLPTLEPGANVNIKPYKSPPRSRYARILRNNLKVSSNHYVTRNASHVSARYAFIPQGGNWTSIPTILMGNYKDHYRCHTGIYYRLKESEPSIVIGNYRKNMLLHPNENRGLSVREAARLQSFPDWFEFLGSIGFQQEQVGNAVPPLLAESIFCEIVSAENNA